jgi:UDP-galactopyranose mutase
MVPQGYSSVSAEISYGNENPLPASKGEMVKIVVNELIKSGILLQDDEILFTDTIDIKFGYVIYDKERKGAVDIIHRYLKSQGIIPCGRYGDWEYQWSDEAILSGKRAAQEINNKN